MKRIKSLLTVVALFAAGFAFTGGAGAQDKDKAPEKAAAEAKAEPVKADVKADAKAEAKAEAKPVAAAPAGPMPPHPADGKALTKGLLDGLKP